MTQADAKRILLAAFRALPSRDRARLRWHAAKGTPILCGDKATLFSDRRGAG